MKRGKKRWPLLALGLAMLASVPFLIFPTLAITAPSGADTVVIEGWIPQEQVPSILEVIQQRRYTRIYTTGTTRDLTYYLKKGDTLDLEFKSAMEGEVLMDLSGLNGARCKILADGDSLLDMAMTAGNVEHRLRLSKPVATLQLISYYPGYLDEDMSNMFIKYLLIDGRNANTLLKRSAIRRADGSTLPGRSNYADALAHQLGRAGVDMDIITALPSSMLEGGRTWSNARSFATRAKADGIHSVDVLSMGIHARRSRFLFRQACGPSITVGVISLEDPLAAPATWWTHRIGWARLFKEVIGMPRIYFMGKEADRPVR